MVHWSLIPIALIVGAVGGVFFLALAMVCHDDYVQQKRRQEYEQRRDT